MEFKVESAKVAGLPLNVFGEGWQSHLCRESFDLLMGDVNQEFEEDAFKQNL